MVFLSEFELSILRKMVQVFTRYHWIWGFESPQRNWQYDTWEAWKAIIDWSHDLEACLMGCTSVTELLEQQKLQNAILKRVAASLSDRKVYHDDWYLSEDPQSSYDPIANPNPPEKDIASALVAQGLIEDWNIAEAMSNVFSNGLISIPDGITTIQDDVQSLNTKIDTLNTNITTLDSRFHTGSWLPGGLGDWNISQVLFERLGMDSAFWSTIDPQWRKSIAQVIYEKSTTIDLDTTGIEGVITALQAAQTDSMTALITAIEALDTNGQADRETLETTLGEIATAIGEIEIINVLAAEGAKVAVKSDCCFDDTTGATGTGDTTTSTDDIWLQDNPYLPTITKDDYLVGDCTPTNTNTLIEIIDALLGTFDWMVETFGMDIAVFLAPKILLFAARASTTVAALLAGANLITVPDPSDAVTIGVTVAGIAFTAILEYVLAQIGIEGLILLLNYYKYDYDLLKAVECGDNDFEIDFSVNAIDYVKSLGKADETAEMIGDAVKRILDLPPFKEIVQ